MLVVSRAGIKAEGRAQGDNALTVPGWIVGTPVDDVRDALPEDLRVSTVSVSSTLRKGTVVATWPGTGEPLTGGQIVLVVADGQDD